MSETVVLPLNRPKPPRIRTAGLMLELGKLRNLFRLQRCWWLRAHTPYQPLFVLATHRSGSNLLIDYLNRLGGIACQTEVLCSSLRFAPLGRRYSTRRALRHLRLTLQSLAAPVRGCKLMLDQLDNSQLTVDDLERNFPGSKFVVLYRQSLAEQFLSLKTANVTKQWVLLPGEKPRAAKVHVERGELRFYCDRTKAAYRRLLETPGLAERAVLLSYEELTADPQHWLTQQICPLVGIQTANQAQTFLRKQNTERLAARVENYREVEALLLSPHCQQHYAWPGRRQLHLRAA
jgi:LPS sulfotransferase NodH